MTHPGEVRHDPHEIGPAYADPVDPSELEEHCRQVANWMASGDVVPFFGAGINLSDRPPAPDYSYTPGRELPSSSELSESIAETFKYPWDDRENLLRVSWYVTTLENGRRLLLQHLHKVFGRPYDTTVVHDFFAALPRALREKGYLSHHQLIVTTNYDDVLERAFDTAGETYDVVTYVDYSKKPSEVGKFRHFPHGGKPRIIETPGEYDDLPIDDNGVLERTIILKIHGAADRDLWKRCHFVITEDDYIDYLARMNPEGQLPNVLLAKLQENIFLFLGYSLSDWNLRVLLRSIGAGQAFGATSWAVMHPAKPWDRAYWKKHNVILKQILLSEYIACLRAQLDALPPA